MEGAVLRMHLPAFAREGVLVVQIPLFGRLTIGEETLRRALSCRTSEYVSVGEVHLDHPFFLIGVGEYRFEEGEIHIRPPDPALPPRITGSAISFHLANGAFTVRPLPWQKEDVERVLRVLGSGANMQDLVAVVVEAAESGMSIRNAYDLYADRLRSTLLRSGLLLSDRKFERAVRKVVGELGGSVVRGRVQIPADRLRMIAEVTGLVTPGRW